MIKFFSKQLYFENQLNAFQGNAYCTWKVIKSLLSSPQKNSIPELSKQDGDVINKENFIIFLFEQITDNSRYRINFYYCENKALKKQVAQTILLPLTLPKQKVK